MTATRRDIGAAAVAIAAVVAASLLGQMATYPNLAPWYANLAKPAFNPPNVVFAPVWTVLYVLMAIAGWRVLRLPPSPQRRTALILFFGQLALNVAWSWMFFAARSPLLGLINVIPQWLVVVATIIVVRPARPLGSLVSRASGRMGRLCRRAQCRTLVAEPLSGLSVPPNHAPAIGADVTRDAAARMRPFEQQTIAAFLPETRMRPVEHGFRGELGGLRLIGIDGEQGGNACRASNTTPQQRAPREGYRGRYRWHVLGFDRHYRDSGAFGAGLASASMKVTKSRPRAFDIT